MHRYTSCHSFICRINTMSLNSKLYEVVSYIQYNKAWEMIYTLLKLPFPCLMVISISYGNRSGMEKSFYYSSMTKISIIKSSSDLDNKWLFPVSSSLYFKVWSSSDSDTEEEYNIDTDYPEIISINIIFLFSVTIWRTPYLLRWWARYWE